MVKRDLSLKLPRRFKAKDIGHMLRAIDLMEKPLPETWALVKADLEKAAETGDLTDAIMSLDLMRGHGAFKK